MKKVLLFDLDHTLWDFDLSEKKALRELFLLESISIYDIEKYIDKYSEINKRMWKEYEMGLISKKILSDTRFEELFSYFNKKVDGIEISKKYSKILGKYGEIFDGVLKLLENLKKDFDIYAATNGIKEIQRNRLDNSEIKEYFKKVYISDEIGYNKPDIRFFEYILNDLKERKENILMIGDNLDADIKGAFNFDISSIWYNKNNKENKLGIKTIEVNNYDELLEEIYNWKNK